MTTGGERGHVKTPKTTVEKAPSRSCSLTGDLSTFAQHAEQKRRQGDWDAAIRLSAQVLECDPGNALAQQVHQKALEEKRLNQ